MRYGSLLIGILVGAAAVAVAWAAVPSAAPEAVGVDVIRADSGGSGLEVVLARQKLYAAKDPLGAARLYERLLEHDLEEDDRLDVLTNLGIAHRNAGSYEASVEALEKVLAISPLGAERGSQAQFQLMWTHKYAGNLTGAIEAGEALAARGVMGRRVAVATHRALGVFAREAGDEARAKEQLERALELTGDDPGMQSMRDDIRSRLDTEQDG